MLSNGDSDMRIPFQVINMGFYITVYGFSFLNLKTIQPKENVYYVLLYMSMYLKNIFFSNNLFRARAIQQWKHAETTHLV